MKYSYTPYGVCSRKIDIDIEDGIIKDCRFTGGCNGNTTGVATLVKGMNAEEAVKKLKGIDCNGRGTSCPDQLALALEEALERE
ncbi:MAG: TIGR03905 family TSCPD domain-containing protein [Ruminococcus sp.]|nr:TIGR03905 family TSCPD domain-containing protein [Ruminococcus sp.]